MILSRPLEDLISPDKAMILTVLERTGQPLTGRTIAALTGTVSQSTTSRLLIDLGRSGLVVKVPGGYEINRDHLAYRALEALLGARDELQRRVAQDVAGWDTPPVSVVLFGSAARRQESRRSDVDLLVVRPATVAFDDTRWAADVANLSERVSRWCGAPCEVLEYSPGELIELQRSNDPLIASLTRDGITFSGVRLDAVLDGPHMTPLEAARGHLVKAQEFLPEANSALANGHPNAATSNAVIAGINAKDAICLVLVGKTSKADDHQQAVAELRKAGRLGADLATTLDRLLKPKTKAQYQFASMVINDAETAVTQAGRLVDAASRVVPSASSGDPGD